MATGDRRQGDLKLIPYDYYWQRSFSLVAQSTLFPTSQVCFTFSELNATE